MEIHPRSANLFVVHPHFCGDTGLDLYTLAVSDAYQDFLVKVVMLAKVFMMSMHSSAASRIRIPENTVLSHDLLEGIMGRAGLGDGYHHD